MARPQRESKVPNPYEKSTLTYFDSTGDGGIRCVAAALSITTDCHVVICAPDIIDLKKAWSIIAPSTPLDLKKTQILLYRYGTPLEQLQREQLAEMDVELSKIKNATMSSRPTRPSQTLSATEVKEELEKIQERNCQLYWFYDPKWNQLAQYYYSDHTEDFKVRLGPVDTGTLDEAKALMRQQRIPRGKIETVTEDDDIPF